ncbi:BQ5605_C015g07848 [Microbotryum silenes-dioicae]|uniref:BQ5605_C015g07848 protein n=1 Tax=Microbotryum silenes-dioicae TaxID=796604 RepID=A0A2X0LWZ2_9BASI|nr:BQ5605_C015g07848 [Microbotryum silenes-dioicae]
MKLARRRTGRNKTVLKNGDSRLVGSSDWPRRTRDLN